jgi:hypothetical protein
MVGQVVEYSESNTCVKHYDSCHTHDQYLPRNSYGMNLESSTKYRILCKHLLLHTLKKCLLLFHSSDFQHNSCGILEVRISSELADGSCLY